MATKLALPLIILTLSTPAFANCPHFEGAAVFAASGQFLGTITPPFHPDSIYNKNGPYGSSIPEDSIWNLHSDFGDRYSYQSVFNYDASSPPAIIRNNALLGYLTVRESKSQAVNPMRLGMVCYGLADASYRSSWTFQSQRVYQYKN